MPERLISIRKLFCTRAAGPGPYFLQQLQSWAVWAMPWTRLSEYRSGDLTWRLVCAGHLRVDAGDEAKCLASATS